MRRILTITLVALPFWLMAQGVTTSSLHGRVRDVNGAVPGARVEAFHEPSGTLYTASTTPDGKFAIGNMRVGGPYQIGVHFPGYDSVVRKDVYLKLGESFMLNVELQDHEGATEHAGQEAHVEASSERRAILTHMHSREILAMPTINRSINDLTRIVPQATSVSVGAIGGGNYRQNNFAIDGSDYNNTFGVGINLPANGSPISLDALEEMIVDVVPFDVRLSGFIGSSMNAVTRSGTNKLSASVYNFFRNEGLQGDQVADEEPLDQSGFTVNTLGFRIGGPIIENKLFLFTNFETITEQRPGQQFHASTPSEPFGSDPNTARPSEDFLNTVGSYLREQYSYEPGPYQDYDFTTTNKRFIVRTDWNISRDHRLSVRYSQVRSRVPVRLNNSRAPLPAFPVIRNSISALPFANSNYYQEANLYSLSTELNSHFGQKFNNNFRVTFTNQSEPRSTDSEVFPFVDILDGAGRPITSFGYEPFTRENFRDVKTYSVVNNLSWASGVHHWLVGAQYDWSKAVNSFQRFATSYYTFNSWSDFQTGVNPRDFAITYSMQPNFAPAYPSAKVSQFSVYGQDEIELSPRLWLTAGLRLEMTNFIETEEVQTHHLVEEQEFEDGRHIDTGVFPATALQFSPRLGLSYDVFGDNSLRIYGGAGMFTGKIPMVWMLSQPGDAGLIQYTQVFEGQANTPGPFNPDPNFYRPSAPPVPGTTVPTTVSSMDEEFRYPESLKSSLSVDKELPWGIVAGIEMIYNKDLEIARGINPNLAHPDHLEVNGYPDHRPIFPAAVTDKYLNPLTSAVAGPTNPDPSTFVPHGDPRGTQAFNPIVLVNDHHGHYSSITLRLEKLLKNNFTTRVAYTRSNAKVLYDGAGDQLVNTWVNTAIVENPNHPEMSYANYVMPHRVIASLSYRKEYLKHFATSVSAFYEASVAGRYSYTYAGDFNGDGSQNDLIYVPRDASEITFVQLTTSAGTWSPQQQSDLFFEYIAQDHYLSKHMGEYAERNGATLPWRGQFDIRIAQDASIHSGSNEHRLQFTFDIFNFMNLLNPSWGVRKLVNSASILVPTNAAALSGNVLPTFRLATFANEPVTETFRNDNSIASTYFMQFGIRYSLN
jgi:hypothetical protein